MTWLKWFCMSKYKLKQSISYHSSIIFIKELKNNILKNAKGLSKQHQEIKLCTKIELNTFILSRTRFFPIPRSQCIEFRTDLLLHATEIKNDELSLYLFSKKLGVLWGTKRNTFTLYLKLLFWESRFRLFTFEKTICAWNALRKYFGWF